jgi:hypothetical protein
LDLQMCVCADVRMQICRFWGFVVWLFCKF